MFNYFVCKNSTKKTYAIIQKNLPTRQKKISPPPPDVIMGPQVPNKYIEIVIYRYIQLYNNYI